jgi:poly(ADP-ribose) glycohydrolase ARH3
MRTSLPLRESRIGVVRRRSIPISISRRANGGDQVRLDRVRGALLGTLLGDVLGAAFEGVAAAQAPASLQAVIAASDGRYTDDTQSMIALAESLTRCGVVDEDDLARTLHAAFDPARGYGAGMHELVQMWSCGVPRAEAAARLFAGRGSLGNGAAMRVAPLAAWFCEDEVLLAVQVRRSARVTHVHEQGIAGALAQAAAVAAALEDREPVDAACAAAPSLAGLIRRIDPAGPGAFSAARLAAGASGHAVTAAGSVPGAVVIGARARSVVEAIVVAVSCGGDTDTVAAMAGAIAGARFGAGSIPENLLAGVEDREKGRSHVERLAAEIATGSERTVGYGSGGGG